MQISYVKSTLVPQVSDASIPTLKFWVIMFARIACAVQVLPVLFWQTCASTQYFRISCLWCATFLHRPWTFLHRPWTFLHRPWTCLHRPWTCLHRPWTCLHRPWTFLHRPWCTCCTEPSAFGQAALHISLVRICATGPGMCQNIIANPACNKRDCKKWTSPGTVSKRCSHSKTSHKPTAVDEPFPARVFY